MKINTNNLQNISNLNLSDANLSAKPAQSNTDTSIKTEYSSANGLHALDGQMRKLQLLQQFAANNVSNVQANLTTSFAASLKRLGGGDDSVKEIKRVLENYHRQIKPSEVKGAPPPEGGKTTAHSRSKHGVKPEVQAGILNEPDRIFSGINDKGRFVDIYYKDGSAVITEFGKKDSVITAYGLIDKKKPNPKPFNIQEVINNPRYVEIKLEGKGATTVIYPNKPRWEANDFPKNPPKPESLPKTNGGANGGTTGSKPPTIIAGSNQEPVATGKPANAPRTLPEDAPVNRPTTGGAATKNISRGVILLQLVQLGLAAHDITQLKADGEKFGYYVDPFFNKYVLTDPDKAAQNLSEGFELKFFPDPNDHLSTGQSITFKVKDGKFVNVDRNYPDHQLYIGADGTVTAGIIA